MSIKSAMTIRKKFKVLAWVAGTALIMVTLISFLTNMFLVKANKDIYEDSTKGIVAVNVIQQMLSEARNKEVLAVSYAAVANIEKMNQLENEMAAQKSSLIAKMGELVIDNKTKETLTDLVGKYFESVATTFSFAKRYVTDEAAKNITENSALPFNLLEGHFNKLMYSQVQTAEQQNKRAVTYAWISRMLLFGTALGAVGLILYLLRISKSIVEPVNAMSGFVKSIAQGELNEAVQVNSSDEIGEMGKSLAKMSVYIRDMATTAEKIAEGDLRINVLPKSDKDVLGNAFQKMIVGLRGLITEIQAGAERLAAASNQIAASAEQTSKTSESSASAVEEMTATMHQMSTNMQNVASNSQKQATTVTETSASIEQMVTSIQHVAENVRNLISISERSKGAVSSGAAAVEQASQGMKGINVAIGKSADTIMSLGEKTEDMSKIVEVIDDIAEQTNLLALNAAIEAAKAGDQGLGFAVVADEVRKLAERSAHSTREIADLIKTIEKEAQGAVDTMTKSTDLVRDGLNFSNEVTQALAGIKAAVEDLVKYSQEIGAATQQQSSGSEQIRKAVQNLNEVIMEISTASEEQSLGAGQVVQAIERIKDMVQQGSSSSLELSASAEELKRQAGSLRGIVSKFSLNGEWMPLRRSRRDAADSALPVTEAPALQPPAA